MRTWLGSVDVLYYVNKSDNPFILEEREGKTDPLVFSDFI